MLQVKNFLSYHNNLLLGFYEALHLTEIELIKN